MAPLVATAIVVAIGLRSAGPCVPPVAGPRDPTEQPWENAVERRTTHEDPVVRQALTVLGQAVNPIRVVSADEIREIYARVPGAGVVPDGLNAFRLPRDPIIYLNSASVAYRSAVRRPSTFTAIRIAATLLHEQVHSTDGELAASRLQADFVLSRLSGLSGEERRRTQKYWEVLNARAVSLSRAHAMSAARKGWR